jgi:hypothetical protein
MSLLFLPLGLLVWVLCYGPFTDEPGETPTPHRDPHRDLG